MHEFVSRRLGPEVAEFAVSSVVRGICAGDSRQVSVHFIAKYLHQLEQETGRIGVGVARDWVRGWVQHPPQTQEEQMDIVKKARAERWAIWGLENGLETLVEKLRDQVTKEGVEIQYGVKVDKILKSGDKLVVTGAENGTALECDKVVLAAPAFTAAGMVSELSSELSSLLSSIPFVNVALVNIQYRGKVLDHQGFGFLVPSSQPDPILGCIYDSCTFPQGNRTLLTVMMGGAWYDEVVGDKSEAEVERMSKMNMKDTDNVDGGENEKVKISEKLKAKMENVRDNVKENVRNQIRKKDKDKDKDKEKDKERGISESSADKDEIVVVKGQFNISQNFNMNHIKTFSQTRQEGEKEGKERKEQN